MRKVGAIKKVGSVSATDGVARVNAYRAAMSARDWGQVTRARLEGPGAQPGVQLKAPSAPPDRALTLPLYLTRHPQSQRGWSEVELLLKRLAEIFAPARLSFALQEPYDGFRSLDGENCPFQEDLDHEYDWLHLALVEKLPGDLPVLPSCGRCLLVPDRCDDREIAKSLAGALGLGGSAEGLMSAGTGLGLNADEVAWLRLQAGVLLGEELAPPTITVPLWVYEVEEPLPFKTLRTQPEMRQLLERVNTVWRQAGIQFDLYNWCHLGEQDLDAQGWQRVVDGAMDQLAPLSQYGPRALHVFLASRMPAELLLARAQATLVVADQLKVERTRKLAAALGRLLGLQALAGKDQLLSDGQGFRLSAPECVRARQGARERLRNRQDATVAQPRSLAALQEEVATPPAELEEIRVPVRIILLRGNGDASRQTLEEAAHWLEGVNTIWSQAGIRLQAFGLYEYSVSAEDLEKVYPNAIDYHGERKPNCGALTRAPGYDPRMLNLFVVHQLPVHGAKAQVTTSTSWSGCELVLLSERYPPYSKEKQLALALARYWGLKTDPQGPFYRLLTPRTVGVRLTAAQVQEARAALQKRAPQIQLPSGASSLPLLCLPVKLHLVQNAGNGTPLDATMAAALLEEANAIYAQAGIAWVLNSCEKVSLGDAALKSVYPIDRKIPTDHKVSAEPLAALSSYDRNCVNLFLTQKIPYANSTLFSGYETFRDCRLAVIADQSYRTPRLILLARGLASFLGLRFRKDDDQALATYRGEGTAMTQDDVKRARAQAEKLLEILEPSRALEHPAQLVLPVRVHLVRNARHGSQWKLSEVHPLLTQMGEWLRPLGIRLDLHLCQELSLAEAPLEAAFPNQVGDTKRKKSVQGLQSAPGYRADALNFFVVGQVVSATGTDKFLSVQDRPGRLVLMTDHDAVFSPLKLLLRALCFYLECPSNDFAEPDCLRANTAGLRLLPREVHKIRTALVRDFPVSETTMPVEVSITPLAQAEAWQLPVRLVLVRGGSNACRWTQAQARAHFGPHYHLSVIQELEVPDQALFDAYPNGPDQLVRIPMNFGLMRLPGHSPSMLNVIVVHEVPSAPFVFYGPSKMLVVGEKHLREGLEQYQPPG